MAGLDIDGGTWTRWRWRLRGAAMWPTFIACLAADVALLLALPPWGDRSTVGDAFLTAGACNLVVVAVLAPLAGHGLRRLRRDLPRVVAGDYAGTALLLGVTAALLGLGLAHRPDVLSAQRAFAAQSGAMRLYLAAHGAAQYRRHADRADSVRLGNDMYRTCVPGDDPQWALCLFIDTSRSPPRVRLDTDHAPNWRYFNMAPSS